MVGSDQLSIFVIQERESRNLRQGVAFTFQETPNDL